MGLIAGCIDFLITRIRFAKQDILFDRSIKQPRILQNHAEDRTQIIAGIIPDIMTIHIDGSAVKFIETHQQLDQCRLTRTGRTNDRHILARSYIHGEIIDDDLFGIITETDILKSHIAPDQRLTLFIYDRHRISSISFFLLLIKQSEDSFSRRHHRLDRIQQLGDRRDRLLQTPNIGRKRLDITDIHRPLDDLKTTDQTDSHITDILQETRQRLHDPGNELGLESRII